MQQLHYKPEFTDKKRSVHSNSYIIVFEMENILWVFPLTLLKSLWGPVKTWHQNAKHFYPDMMNPMLIVVHLSELWRLSIRMKEGERKREGKSKCEWASQGKGIQEKLLQATVTLTFFFLLQLFEQKSFKKRNAKKLFPLIALLKVLSWRFFMQ